jgi:ferredoxin
VKNVKKTGTSGKKRSKISEMTKKPKVDKDKCIGCGTCVLIADKSFKLGDDGKAEAIEPAGDPQAKIQEAVESCPVGAISTEE